MLEGTTELLQSRLYLAFEQLVAAMAGEREQRVIECGQNAGSWL